MFFFLISYALHSRTAYNQGQLTFFFL